MTEKMHKSNTYVSCYCSRNAEISVGSKIFVVLNLLAAPLIIILCVWMASSNIPIYDKLIVIILLSIPLTVLPRFDYIRARRHMQNAGHSEVCSRKTALLVMLHSGSVDGLFSDFKIIKDHGNVEISPLNKTRKRK